MRSLLFIVVASCFLKTAFGGAQSAEYTYLPSSEWEGVCATGKRQSPINFDNADIAPAPEWAGRIEIETFGTLSAYTDFFTGHSLEIQFRNFSEAPVIRIPANEYIMGSSEAVKQGEMVELEAIQMHYHTLSEHTVDGFYAPGELHIVMKVKDGESDYCDDTGGCLAVFGILTTFEGDGSKSNPALEQIFATMPTYQGLENGVELEKEMNLDELLPNSRGYYTYLGSLTTPPCSEIVTWHVFAESIPISAKLVEAHQRLVSQTPGDDCTWNYFGVCSPPREKTNDRRIQPLHKRQVFFAIA